MNFLIQTITPRHPLLQGDEQRNARVFLGIIAVLILTGLLLLLPRAINGEDSSILVSALTGLVIIYAIGRFLSWTVSKTLLLGLLIIELPVIYFGEFYPPLTFTVAIFVAVLGAVLTRPRTLFIITAIDVSLLIMLVMIRPSPIAEGETVFSILMITLLICALVLLLAAMREADTTRLSQHSAALRESEERFRQLLESSPEMIAVQSGSKFLYINATGVRMLGAKSASDIIGQDVRQFMTEHGRSNLSSRLKHIGTEETLTVTFDQTFRRVDGRPINTTVTASSITYNGDIASLLVVRDTGSGLAQPVEAVKSEFEELLNVLPVSMLVTTGSTIRFASRQVEIMSGYHQTELPGMPLERLTDDAALIGTDVDTGLYQERVVRFRHRNGQPYYVMVRSQPGDYRGEPAMFHATWDVTRLWQREQMLTLLQTAVESQQEAVIVTDANVDAGGIILYVNPAFTRMTGYSPEDIIGKTPRVLQGPLTGRQMLIELRRALEDSKPFTGEAVNYRQDGTPYTVQWSVTPVRSTAGVVTHFVLTQRDITEQKRLADSLNGIQQRYQVITEMMSDFSCAFDIEPDGTARLVWMVGAFEAMTGYSLAEIRQMQSWEDLVYPEDLDIVRERHVNLMLRGKPSRLEFRLKSKTAPFYCYVSDSSRPVWDEAQQRVVQIYSTAQNIQERVRAEQQLKGHIVQQAVVVELGLLALLSDSHAETLLEHTVVLCEQVIEASLCEIARYNPDAQMMTVVASTGMTLGAAFRLDEASGSAGYAITTSEPVISASLNEDRRFQLPGYLRETGIATGASVLIHSGITPFGVLSVYSRQAHIFTEDDIYFLQSIANVIGTSLERSRAQAAEREQREFAEALQEITLILNSKFELSRVLETVLEFIAQVIPEHEASTIWLLEADGNTLRFAASRGYDSIKDELPTIFFHADTLPVAAQMIATRQPVLINNTLDSDLWTTPANASWIRAYVGAPIILEDEFIGFINVDSSREGAFTEEAARRLQTFAGKIGTAIRNASRAEELDRRVTERTQEVASRHEQLQAILDSSGEGIIHTEDFKIVFANRALLDMTGYSQEEVLGGTMEGLLQAADVTPQELEVLRGLLPVVRAGKTWRNEMRIRRKDGTTFDAGLTISLVGKPGDAVLRAVTIVRDIRREKELEQQKTRFIANAAHELRSPITNLNTRLYLMRRQPEQTKEHVALLEKVVVRMNRLVSDLLDMSYFEQGRIMLQEQDVILQDILLDVIELQQPEASAKQIDLRQDMPPNPVHLLGDPQRLNQVFTNLVVNAIAYTPEQGIVLIEMLVDDTRSNVVTSIRDTGSGIPESNLENIFEPFVRLERNHPGTGLGLSIAREIVELHDGTITAANASDSGAVFTVCLKALLPE